MTSTLRFLWKLDLHVHRGSGVSYLPLPHPIIPPVMPAPRQEERGCCSEQPPQEPWEQQPLQVEGALLTLGSP